MDHSYIGTMTRADTLGMYAILAILALLAFGMLAALIVQIRDNDDDGLFPITDALAKSDYADLVDERVRFERVKQEHVTPLLLDLAPTYVPEGWATPYAAPGVPPAAGRHAGFVGRHRAALLTEATGEWAVVTGELVSA